MKTYSIKPRIDYTAHEITREDFLVLGDNISRITGVVYRRETLTVRLATSEEVEDNSANSNYAEEPAPKVRKYEAREKGVAPPGKYSFYGVGCYIICQNGKPIDIIGPDRLGELYHVL